MKDRLKNRIEWLRTSYWVVPGAMLLGAALLSVLTVWYDARLQNSSSELAAWLSSMDVHGARELLSMIAGSMIAVAGVVFSITIVALSLATSQFGPRLLNNFIRDSSNKVSLGTFISTFFYCVLVLRTVRAGEEPGEPVFVPYLGVTVALVLGFASLCVLIYFIHHVAASIRASHVIALVGNDLQAAIERLFPDSRDRDDADARGRDALPAGFDDDSKALPAGNQGYLQAIERDTLIELAKEHDLVIRASVMPGDFVVRGVELVRCHPGALSEELQAEIDAAFLVGRHRTAEQDIRMHINQLAEVAIRALSPGVNDPFTAITCVDWLGAALCTLVSRRPPSERLYDEEGALRLIVGQVAFREVVDAAFSQIRHYGRDNKAVIRQMIRALTLIANDAVRDGDRAALRTEARSLGREALETLRGQVDPEDPIFAEYEVLIETLGIGGSAGRGDRLETSAGDPA
ncbi:MAG: DUF2254 domain-containing protein [Nannocystaceae bacterium]